MTYDDNDLNAAWHHISVLEKPKSRFYQDSMSGTPTIGAGYTPIVDNGRGKWVLRPSYKDDFKSAGITLAAEHEALLKQLEGDMNAGGVKDNPKIDQTIKNLQSIIMSVPQAKSLFAYKYTEYRDTARRAVGADVFDRLDAERKAALTGIAYQSPRAMAKAGSDIAKHVKAGDHTSAAKRIRAIGGELGDSQRYNTAGDIFENPALPGMIVVKSGDNLSKLAKESKTTVDAFAKLNNLPNVDLIRAGTTLRVPEPVKPARPVISGGAGDKELGGSSGDDGLDTAEGRAFRDTLMKADHPAEEILLKEPRDWTEDEMRHVKSYRFALPSTDPRADEIAGREDAWFERVYSTAPVKHDASGRMIQPAAVNPPPAKAKPALDSDGRPLADGLKRVADKVLAAARDDGLPNAVKSLQKGVNLLQQWKQPEDKTGDKPEFKAKRSATASFLTLKEDGVAGPKTRAALKRTVATHGSDGAENAMALARFNNYVGAARKRGFDDLDEQTGKTFGPLFRNEKQTPSAEKAYRPESAALQDTLNDLGPKTFGKSWTPLKDDGWIGPKTTRAFENVAKTTDPEKLSKRYGQMLGFL